MTTRKESPLFILHMGMSIAQTSTESVYENLKKIQKCCLPLQEWVFLKCIWSRHFSAFCDSDLK